MTSSRFVFLQILPIVLMSACTQRAEVQHASLATPKLDPSVRVQTLDNGLTVVAQEVDGADWMSVRLVVEAGGQHQRADELGVAHALEHMAFNGIEHFEGGEMVRWFEEQGVAFGQHQNASTSWTHTVYRLDVPNRDEVVDTSLVVLRSWMDGITLDPTEVEAERGVLIEERRLRSQRVLPENVERFEKLAGSEAALAALTAEQLRGFYDAWYRPERMTVVVTGSRDASAMVSELAERFADVRARGPERELEEGTSAQAIRAEPYVKVIDGPPKWVSAAIAVVPPTSGEVGSIEDVVRQQLARAVAHQALEKVLPAAAVKAQLGFEVTSADALQRVVQALGRLSRDRKNLEVEEARALIRSARLPSATARSRADGIALFVVRGEHPATDPVAMHERMREILSSMSTDAVHEELEQLLQPENLIVSASGLGSREEVVALVESAWRSSPERIELAETSGLREPVEARTTEAGDPLASAVVVDEKVEDGVQQWRLSNGVQMAFRQNDRLEKFRLLVWSPRGHGDLALDGAAPVARLRQERVPAMGGTSAFASMLMVELEADKLAEQLELIGETLVLDEADNPWWRWAFDDPSVVRIVVEGPKADALGALLPKSLANLTEVGLEQPEGLAPLVAERAVANPGAHGFMMVSTSGDSATIQMMFSAPWAPSRDALATRSAAYFALEGYFREAIREVMGATYSVGVKLERTFVGSEPGLRVSVLFHTDVKRKSEVIEASKQLVETLRRDGFSSDVAHRAIRLAEETDVRRWHDAWAPRVIADLEMGIPLEDAVVSGEQRVEPEDLNAFVRSQLASVTEVIEL